MTIDILRVVWDYAAAANNDVEKLVLDYVLFEYQFRVDGTAVHESDGYADASGEASHLIEPDRHGGIRFECEITGLSWTGDLDEWEYCPHCGNPVEMTPDR